jgi:hypothetical protein
MPAGSDLATVSKIKVVIAKLLRCFIACLKLVRVYLIKTAGPLLANQKLINYSTWNDLSALLTAIKVIQANWARVFVVICAVYHLTRKLANSLN